VKVKGPKGEITKSFKHMPVELKLIKQQGKNRKGLYLNLKMWFGGTKQSCSVATLKSLIRNMISGVINGYRYKMRLVHAHFPINVNISKDARSIEVKNFLGGKEVKKIDLLPGTTVKLNPDLKDELIFEGIDNQNVSLSCAQVGQVCKIGGKDNRKFLDGIYVSERGQM
jgi:large subunit ribosomal protein L9e